MNALGAHCLLWIHYPTKITLIVNIIRNHILTLTFMRVSYRYRQKLWWLYARINASNRAQLAATIPTALHKQTLCVCVCVYTIYRHRHTSGIVVWTRYWEDKDLCACVLNKAIKKITVTSAVTKSNQLQFKLEKQILWIIIKTIMTKAHYNYTLG